MNILKGFALLTLVLILGACGTTMPTQTVELELQALTSVPDSEPVTELAIFRLTEEPIVPENSTEEPIVREEEFVDRFRTYRLPPDKYIVRLIAHTEQGSVTTFRDVDLFSDTSIKVDARSRIRADTYEDSAERVEVSFVFPWISSSEGGARFRHAEFLMMHQNFRFSGVITSLEDEVEEGEGHATLVRLTRPEEIAGNLTYAFAYVSVAREPHSCGEIGSLSASWKNSSERVHESTVLDLPCKG